MYHIKKESGVLVHYAVDGVDKNNQPYVTFKGVTRVYLDSLMEKLSRGYSILKNCNGIYMVFRTYAPQFNTKGEIVETFVHFHTVELKKIRGEKKNLSIWMNEISVLDLEG